MYTKMMNYYKQSNQPLKNAYLEFIAYKKGDKMP